MRLRVKPAGRPVANLQPCHAPIRGLSVGIGADRLDPNTGMEATLIPDFDAIIIGAGMSGLYQLYRLREQGLRVRVFEAGTDVGGTWYWNRYPGARFDSESYSYQYFFLPELVEEWDWSEHFAGQAETESYLNFVTDKLELRDLMQFRTRIASADFDEQSATWTLTTEDGGQLRARFLI